jgi:predicted Zn-dependent protease
MIRAMPFQPKQRLRRAVAGLAVLAMATSSVAQQPALPDLGDTAQSTISPQYERQIGEQVMREFRKDPSFLDDPEVIAYIDGIGQRLVAVSSDARSDFDFFVVKDASINAFAMPGGFVGVHSGLILAAQSESELAGVLAHEVSHVTQRHIARQFEKQSQLQWAAIAGLVLGVLAARSNPQVAQAAIMGGQAGAIQAALAFSRDFEREADRVGFQVLDDAGFDVNGMPAFFERLGRATRLVENNAPVYLRTHPLSSERMADLQNRAASARYRQRVDSIEFQLVRAKLRALQGAPREGVAIFETQLKDRRFASEAAAQYGLAVALAAARDWKRADAALGEARRLAGAHAMFETLGARIKAGAGQGGAAREQLARAMKDFPGRFYVAYAYADVLQSLNQHAAAVDVLEELVRARPRDSRVHRMLARSYAGVGKRAAQHRSQAEYYVLEGSLPAAVDQLESARRAGDADFYALSSIDARMRELRRLQQEQREQRGQSGQQQR